RWAAGGIRREIDAAGLPGRIAARAARTGLVRPGPTTVTALAGILPAQRGGREHVGGRAGQVTLLRLAPVAGVQRVVGELVRRERIPRRKGILRRERVPRRES